MSTDEPSTDPAESRPAEPPGRSAAETLARALGTAIPNTALPTELSVVAPVGADPADDNSAPTDHH